MFYSAVISIIGFLILLLNGRTKVDQKERIPKESNVILIAPHRSWLDPVFLALASYPMRFTFMAKKEIFKNPLVRWLAEKMNAFPVDRENPGPSAIKTPVKTLKEGNLSLMMFPSGTRHATDLKGGAITIAKLSGKPIVPAVYSGPYTLKDVLRRRKAIVRYGEPIIVERSTRLDHDTIKRLSTEIQESFDLIEKEIQNDH